MSEEKYTVSGLSREFVKHMQMVAHARGWTSDYHAVSEVARQLHIEDGDAENTYINSFRPGDQVKITFNDDPRQDTQYLTITNISLDQYAVGKHKTRVWFDDKSWCWLDKFTPDWINKV